MNANRLIMLSLAAALGLTLVTELRAQERENRESSRSYRDSSSSSSSRSRESSRDRDRREESPVHLTTAPKGYTDRYAVIESRNFFLRDRSRPASRPSNSSSSSPTTRRSAEESLVLRGIAMEYDGFRAYVEDLNSGSTLRVSPGESLARGHVMTVAIDAIEYEHDG